ncbi:MAG: hypothetical protein WC773_04300 [Patescibacteria group bacterium]|jgi:hypothetical protein
MYDEELTPIEKLVLSNSGGVPAAHPVLATRADIDAFEGRMRIATELTLKADRRAMDESWQAARFKLID